MGTPARPSETGASRTGTLRMDLDEAAALITACGYHRRDQELADAQNSLTDSASTPYS